MHNPGMREEDLRKILLVKAVEEADADGTLVPPADRAAAGREAMREAGANDPDRLLALRANHLLARITARHPFVARVLALLGPSWRPDLVLAVAGLILGAALPVLDGSQRINVLAFPLLGVVGWNLAVYLVLAVALLRRGKIGAAPARSMLASAGSWLARRAIAASRGFNAPLAEALQSFARQWLDAARPLLAANAGRALHLAAAAVGVGLVASLYVRGIAFDYRAGWESTFLDASGARALLGILYGPASWLTGIPVPGVAELEAARWRPGGGGGEPAARWMHLIAATALVYVIVPRLLLAITAGVRAARFTLRAPRPDSLAPYFRTAFASVEGAVARARAGVMPFAYEMSPNTLARLIAWIPGAAGGPVDVEARESLPYGEEEGYLAGFAARGGDRADIVVMPFSLATTPEAENHGEVLAGVRDRLAASRPGARLLVVVDEAPYAARMAGAPDRIAERREAWRAFVRAHGLDAQFVSLA
jgi:hypothetical protein